jgi:hypothetical protein
LWPFAAAYPDDVHHVATRHHRRLVEEEKRTRPEACADAARAAVAWQVAEEGRGVLGAVEPGGGQDIARGLARRQSDHLAAGGCLPRARRVSQRPRLA